MVSGMIYKIVNSEDDMVFIGATQIDLLAKLRKHLYRAMVTEKPNKFYNHVRLRGPERFSAEIIRVCECESRDELLLAKFEEIRKADKSKLLNEDTEYKRFSQDHSRKIGEAHRGEKSHRWKYGSLFIRTTMSIDGHPVHAWCFDHRTEAGKSKRYQYSIHKHGYERAYELVVEKRKEVFPDARDLE